MKCPYCGSSDLIFFPERGELICKFCGTVVQERIIDYGPEWRAFTPEQRERKSRVGAPPTPTIHDLGLTTTIDWRNKDYSGRILSGMSAIRAKRLRIIHRKIRIRASEKRTVQILSKVNRLINKMGLPQKVQEETCIILRKLMEVKLLRGRIIDNYIAAAIYLACRFQKIPRTLDEIAKYVGVPRKDVALSYRKLLQLLGKSPPPAKPVDYIPRLISKLKLPPYVQTKAAEILNYMVRNGLSSGKGPLGIAAASVYLASVFLDEKRTQREVADAANVTEVTVRNRYKEFIDNFCIIVKL